MLRRLVQQLNPLLARPPQQQQRVDQYRRAGRERESFGRAAIRIGCFDFCVCVEIFFAHVKVHTFRNFVFVSIPTHHHQPSSGAWTANQAKMERTIANHSRQFGEGVQTIVATAKAKGTDDWKTALLDLLGQTNPKSDIDILLANHTATNFCKICLEHELPPNLVHCLRLLRVLELQNASTNAMDATPLSITATNKVSRLLILLCKTDTAVGDQLRPHLFGLFALSGASYPQSGIHVAAAAAAVIAQYPLTANTVWFIHDRKMLIHMTDDVKELAAATEEQQLNETTASASAVVPCGLTGKDAEAAGLLVIASNSKRSIW
jgi:hypothetical protein